MTESELLRKICDRVAHLCPEDCTTAERQIIRLLVGAGYMKLNLHGMAVLKEEVEYVPRLLTWKKVIVGGVPFGYLSVSQKAEILESTGIVPVEGDFWTCN